VAFHPDQGYAPSERQTNMQDPSLSHPYLLAVLAGAVLVAILLAAIVWRKGRPFSPGTVFRASRLTAGNRLFPTQVLITPVSVVHYTPRWFGRLEHSIHIAHVASVRIDTKLVFSDVFIETSGGVSPISCYGHRKKDAFRIKDLIDKYQSDYFKAPVAVAPPAPAQR
jgi:hypothetical protein